MAKRLSSSQGEIILRNDENFKKKNIIYREPKIVKSIQSLCKKGFSGPGIKKTNQDNFFILIILIIIQIIFTWVCVMGMEFLVKI